MTAYFDAAFKDLMYWEGGARFHVVNGDLGGATKYGISLRFLKGLPRIDGDIDQDGHVNELDVRALTEDKARAFYLKHFWLHYQLQAIESAPVAAKLLNIFVNMRGNVAGRVAQRALGSCRINDVREDGYIGPLTQSAINELCCSKELTAMYLAALRAQQEGVYRVICANNPSMTKFLTGWIRRARDDRRSD